MLVHKTSTRPKKGATRHRPQKASVCGKPLARNDTMHRPARPTNQEPIAQRLAGSWRFACREALGDAYLADDVVTDRQSLWARRLNIPSVIPGKPSPEAGEATA